VERVYFDHNATTPVASEVLEAMVPAFGQTYGNASSIHHFGQAAKQRLEAARRQIAALIHAHPAEVVFTSGGTEADNMAVLGIVRGVSGPRHVTRLPVGSTGVLDPESIRRALRAETVLVSVMHANNELGTVQPIAEIARITREAGVVFHVDGVQALGKIPVNVSALGADLYSMSAHKLYGPKGVGALYVRKGTRIAALTFGGHHERDRRPGTENVPAIVGFGVAAELAAGNLATDGERIAGWRDRLETVVLDRIGETGINGARTARTPNTTNIYFDGIDGEALVIALDLRGFAVSTGSACSSGAVTPSHVLTAIGLSAERARASIRFSLGTSTTGQQVDALVEALEASVVHLRRISVHA
jgi:cysteine desulfurase